MTNWTIHLTARKDAAEFLADNLVEEGISVSISEVPDSELWHIHIITNQEPDPAAWRTRLELLADLVSATVAELTISVMEEKDWVAETLAGFPPFSVGRFYIHGSHIESETVPGQHSIELDAGMAFGTGEHATTKGCLLVIDQLADLWTSGPPGPLLDMGCGTGILAIAMAKCWSGSRVQAVDIDELAVNLAWENAENNHVADRIDLLASEGFADERIAKAGPYALITANILANPLQQMAQQLASHLMPRGITILSGLLKEQREDVQASYEAVGMQLVESRLIDGWATLHMQRTT